MESVNFLGSTSPVNTVLKRRPDGIPGFSSLTLPELSTKTTHCRDLFSPGPATVLSPVTNLALDMNNLVVLGRYYSSFVILFLLVLKLTQLLFIFFCKPWENTIYPNPESGLLCTSLISLFIFSPHSQCDTPKRRKHAPLEKIPSFASDVSSDAGEPPPFLKRLLSVLIETIIIDASVPNVNLSASYFHKSWWYLGEARD